MSNEKTVKKLQKRYITNPNKRESYIYKGANQPAVTIIPGENGVTEVDIDILHAMDDGETRAWNRYIGKTNHYIDDFVGESLAEHNRILADWNANPLTEILDMENSKEKQELIDVLHDSMQHLTDKQFNTLQKSFYDNRTNVDIAAAEVKSETAIRKRKNSAIKRLKNLMTK